QHVVDEIGIGDYHLQALHPIAQAEVALRLGERHEDEARVVTVFTDLEGSDDAIAYRARHDAERRRRAFGRQQGHAVTDFKAVILGKAHADGDTVIAAEILQAARL